MSTRIPTPESAIASAACKDGTRCYNTSCTCGRGAGVGHRAASMGQKITSDLFLKQKQEMAKYHLYTMMYRLLGTRMLNK